MQRCLLYHCVLLVAMRKRWGSFARRLPDWKHTHRVPTTNAKAIELNCCLWSLTCCASLASELSNLLYASNAQRCVRESEYEWERMAVVCTVKGGGNSEQEKGRARMPERVHLEYSLWANLSLALVYTYVHTKRGEKGWYESFWLYLKFMYLCTMQCVCTYTFNILSIH